MPGVLLEDGWRHGVRLDGPSSLLHWAGRPDVGVLTSCWHRALRWAGLTIKVLKAGAVPALQLAAVVRAGALRSSSPPFQRRCAYCMLHFPHLQPTRYLTAPFTGTNPADCNEEWDGSCDGVAYKGAVHV